MVEQFELFADEDFEYPLDSWNGRRFKSNDHGYVIECLGAHKRLSMYLKRGKEVWTREHKGWLSFKFDKKPLVGEYDVAIHVDKLAEEYTEI